MIRKVFNYFLILLFSFTLVNCVATVRPRHAPPPPPRRIHKIAKPGPQYFWVSGHYVWRGGRYVWVKGHWKKKRPGYVWVQGHWAKRGGYYVWIEGHWRRRR